MAELLPLGQEQRTGVILVVIAGGLSTLAVSTLLLHMCFVAILSPLKQLSSPQKVPRERVFLATHLGYYLTCLLISGLFGGVASSLGVVWVQRGAILQNGTCNTQGIFLQFGEIGTAAFSVIIAFHTMNNLVIQKRLPTFAVLFVILLGWVISVILAVIGPFMSNHFYDIEGLWCWISVNQATFQVFGSLVPLLVSVILMVFLYGATCIKLRYDANEYDDNTISLSGTVALSSDDYRKFLRPVAQKLFFYPLVFAILVLPISIVRIVILLGMSVPNYAIVIAAVCDALLGFANTIVYVTTRNVGPSINWDGIRSSAKGLLRPESSKPNPISRSSEFLPGAEHLGEKVDSVYPFDKPRLVETTNSSEIRISVTSPPVKPYIVRVQEETPPSFRTIPGSDNSSLSEYSQEDIEPMPAFVHRAGAANSVSRWRERQDAYQAARSRVMNPTSVQYPPTSLRSSHSLSSIRSYERAPTPLIRRTPNPMLSTPSAVLPSEESLTIIESYFDVPDSLRPGVPGVARSNGSDELSFTSQESLISHIRAISNSSSVSGTSCNPRVQPSATGGANLPFSLYPGV